MSPGYKTYRNYILSNIPSLKEELIEYKEKEMNDPNTNILDFLRLVDEIRELKDLKAPMIDFIRGYNI